MAFRADISIDWTASPRIITVAAPSAEVTMQDLLDTLRTLESQPSAMDNDFIVDAAGKENLGGGVLVGLTVTLQNAKLAFEARVGPTFTLCRVSGGNLVAVDVNGNTFDSPIEPTAYVQVVLANSSSATLQEQSAIQFASFQNRVWVDVINGSPGTDFPQGTREHPVDNIVEAVFIATLRGFDTIGIIGDITIGAGDDVSGFIIEGQSTELSYITIETAADCLETEVRSATVIDTVLDGDTIIRDCVVENLTYVEGRVCDSMLKGTIILGGTDDSYFIRCVSGSALADLSDAPIIDMGGSGRNCVLRSFSGPVKIINLTGANKCAIDFESGHLILDATMTGGTVTGRGTFTLDDSSDGTTIELDGQVEANHFATHAKTKMVEALATDTYPESATPPAATASIAAKISWLVTLALNKIIQTSTQQKVRNNADGADVGTASVSDDGSTFTRGKWQ